MKILKSEQIHQGHYIKLRQDLVKGKNGREYTRDVIEHPGAVVIVPYLGDGNFVLLKQHRHPLNKDIWEFPAGTLDPGEEPEFCARRELKEETGYTADSITFLGTIYATPGFCDEIQHCYLAKDLVAGKTAMEEDEDIETHILSQTEIERMVLENELKDAKSLAIYHLATRRL